MVADGELSLVAALDVKGSSAVGQSVGGSKVTTDLGAISQADVLIDFTRPEEGGLDFIRCVRALKPELDKVFKPAFLGRMVIIPYFPVRDENLKQIIRLKLGKIARRTSIVGVAPRASAGSLHEHRGGGSARRSNSPGRGVVRA